MCFLHTKSLIYMQFFCFFRLLLFFKISLLNNKLCIDNYLRVVLLCTQELLIVQFSLALYRVGRPGLPGCFLIKKKP